MLRFLRLLPILLFLLAVVGLSLALPASAQCSPRTDWDVYTVARGDTLSSIARRFGTIAATLIAGNCLANPNYLLVGQPIRVPPGSSAPPGWSGGAPDFPVYSSDIAATFQWFDSGFMIWRADTGSIWVFIQQGRSGGGIVRQFPLNVYGGRSGDARYMGEIPPGRGLPVFGFAKVYANFADVRAALGWAVGSEQGFLMRVQPSDGGPYFTIWRLDGLSVRIYIDQTFQTLSDPFPTAPLPAPPPTYSTGATFQPFQYGFMVWRADTGEIRAYFGANTGELATYPAWQYGALGQPFVPPVAGFPVEFGFGKVWHHIPGVRERLGWATGGERGYTMLIDNTTPGAPSFTLPDGQTVYNIGGNTWAFTGSAPLLFGEVLPTPTAPAAGSGPQVSLFAVSPALVMPGDTVLVSWEVYNAGNIGLTVTYRADYRLFFDYTSDALPTFSSTTITIPDHTDVFNSEATFQLYWAYDAAPENWVPIEGATRTVWIGCPYPLFWYQAGCAYAPEQQMPALYQMFERGFMLRADEAVYPVIFNGEHQATIFAEIERVEIGTPPDGLYAPDAAFTDLWTSTPRYLELLGWATAPAQSYTARVQTEHYTIRGDNMRNNYVTLPDGRVLQLSGSVFGGPAVRWDWVR